jgi:molybdenum cofactor guanylyltransferase
MTIKSKQIAAVILAGGKGVRMGGANKALLMLGGQTLASHVARRLAPQVGLIGINANRDHAAMALQIVPDGIGGNLGPLDGILGAMLFAAENGYSHVLTVAVDTPFIPMDMATRLAGASTETIAIAASNGRLHGICGLWPVECSGGLKAFILSGKSLKVMDYLRVTGFVEIGFTGNNPDPFFNINTPGDLEAAAGWL